MVPKYTRSSSCMMASMTNTDSQSWKLLHNGYAKVVLRNLTREQTSDIIPAHEFVENSVRTMKCPCVF